MDFYEFNVGGGASTVVENLLIIQKSKVRVQAGDKVVKKLCL
jgi:hypothetical protein